MYYINIQIWFYYTMTNSILDLDAVRELELSAEHNCNEEINIYGKVFSKFWKAGTFDKVRAVNWVSRSIINDSAKTYCQVNCNRYDSKQWRIIFPKPERNEAAKNIVEKFISEFEAGNFWN